MHLSLIDVLVVVLYAVFILVLAQAASRRSKEHIRVSKGGLVAERSLPWWAIGTSLIAANISAEQIIGMSGSGYAIGLGIASYEWMSALTLLIVGKFFLPIFLKNQIYTMPEFLKRRYGRNVQLVMAVFWLVLYIFVNLTAILWLGATAVHTVTGLTVETSVVLLALFAGNYALYGGLEAAAVTDVVQVTMLVLGGLVIVAIALERISGGSGLTGLVDGFHVLMAREPSHFHMIIKPDSPFYEDLPGISVIAGGMWVMNLSYWGFNQYIIQRALGAKDIREAQKGVVLASFLKLLIPVLVVVPGIAAAVLSPHLSRPDEAYPQLMTLLPSGLLGLVFVALIAAIIASMGSAIKSVATIFTGDVFKVIRKDVSARTLVITGRFVSVGALAIAMLMAKPLLGNVDQAFQYIQNFTGFFTPGIVVIFLLGMFWKRATEAGALAAAVGSVGLSYIFYNKWPHIAALDPIGRIPFLNRVGYVFVICLAAAIAVSLLQKQKPQASSINVTDIDYKTSAAFNIASIVIILVLIALYAIWW